MNKEGKSQKKRFYLLLGLVILGLIIYSIFFYYRNLLYGPSILFDEDTFITINIYPNHYQAALVFTNDDINKTSEIEKINKVTETLDRHGVKAVFFVIPYFQGRYLLQEGDRVVEALGKITKNGHEIALHGYTHRVPRLQPGSLIVQEFARLPFSEKKRRILKGKKILEELGFKIQGFRNPGFKVDLDILKIIDEHGFLFDSNTRKYPFRLITNKQYLESLYYPFHPRDLNLIEYVCQGDYFWNYPQISPQEDLAILKRTFDNHYAHHGVFVLLSHLKSVSTPKSLALLENFLTYTDPKKLWKPNLSQLSQWWLARESL
jgi:predicted deacetylase